MLRLLMSQSLEEIGKCYIQDATSPSSKGQTAPDLHSPRAHASYLMCTLQEGEVSLLKLNEQRKTQEGPYLLLGTGQTKAIYLPKSSGSSFPFSESIVQCYR